MAKKNQGTAVWNPAVLAALRAGKPANQAVYAGGAAPPKGRVVPGVTQGTPGAPPNPGGRLGPAVTPQPFDPATAETALIGGRNVAITNGNAAYDEGNLSFDYGYNPDGTVNTANPYSRAALYQLAYTNSKRGTLNGMAAQGQLYSGAYGTAQNLNDATFARNDAANRLAYSRGIHGIQSGQLGAYANAGSGVSDADFKSLLNSAYPTGG